MGSEAKGYIRVPVWVDAGVVKSLVNDDGRVPVVLELSDITLDVNLETSDIILGVTESSPLTSIQSQLYGWDLNNWCKNPIVFGYTDIYAETKGLENVAAGDRTLTFDTIDAGYVCVVTTFSAWSEQANPSRVDFYHHDGTTLRRVSSRAYPTANWSVESVVPVYLDVNSYLKVTFRDCVLNDDIHASAFGYIMKVNE